MKLHIIEKHCSEFGNQTELIIEENEENEPVFGEFLCFYCEILLKNREVLEMHNSECHKIPLTDFPCDMCGLQCLSEEQLEIHKRSYHAKESYQNVTGQSNNENVKSCDFCGLEFGTLGIQGSGKQIRLQQDRDHGTRVLKCKIFSVDRFELQNIYAQFKES